MYYERKQDNKKYHFKVDNNLKDKGRPVFGETDDKKRIVKINKKFSKKHKRKPGYPELKDTILHEKLHTEHNDWTEKKTYKETKKRMKRIGKKASKKLYNLVK